MINYNRETYQDSLKWIKGFYERYNGKLAAVSSDDAKRLKEEAFRLGEVIKPENFSPVELQEIITVMSNMEILLAPSAVKVLDQTVKVSIIMAASKCKGIAKDAEQKKNVLAENELKVEERKKEALGTRHVTIPDEHTALETARRRIQQFIQYGILNGKKRFELQQELGSFSVTASIDEGTVMNDQPVYVNLILSISGTNNRLANVLDALFEDTAKGPIDVVLEKQDEGEDWWFTTPKAEIIDLLMYRASYSAMMIMSVGSILHYGQMTGSAPHALENYVASLESVPSNANSAREYSIQSSIAPGAVLYVLAPPLILQEIQKLLPSNATIVLIPVTGEIPIKRGKEPKTGENRRQRAVSVEFKVPDYSKAAREVLNQLIIKGGQTAVIHMTRLH